MRTILTIFIVLLAPTWLTAQDISDDDKTWFESHGCKVWPKRPEPLPKAVLWAKGYLCHESNFKRTPASEIVKHFAGGEGVSPPPADPKTIDVEVLEKPVQKEAKGAKVAEQDDHIPTLEEWMRGQGCQQVASRPHPVPNDHVWHKGYLCTALQITGWQDLKDAKFATESPAIAHIPPLRGLFAVEDWKDNTRSKFVKSEKGSRFLAISFGTIRSGTTERGKPAITETGQADISTNPFHVKIKCGSGIYQPNSLAPKGLGPRYPSMELEPGEKVSGWLIVELPKHIKPEGCKARFEDFQGRTRWINLSDSYHLTSKK